MSKRLPHTAVLDTVTLVNNQILVDLTRFQTVDGVHFSYRHLRIVSRELAVNEVCNSTLVQTKLRLDVIREGTNRVQQPFQLIRISDIQLQIIHVKKTTDKLTFGSLTMPSAHPIAVTSSV